MQLRTSFYFLLLNCFVALLAHAEELTIPSKHAGMVSVLADFPSGDGPFPAIVLAPGQGYHMRLPALAEPAKMLVASGVAVFRFHWAYFTAQPKGNPSDDLAKELQDLQAVLGFARSHPRILHDSVMVGGKSLGSVVAWQALEADASLRAGVFLTPICSRVATGETVPRSVADENYPGMAREARPILFVSGDRDPLCTSTLLYQFAAKGTSSTRVAVVGGDHSFEEPSLRAQATEAANGRHIAAVATITSGFVADVTAKQ
jgi:predicted alpha/beta-hydrolase family hydrolase